MRKKGLSFVLAIAFVLVATSLLLAQGAGDISQLARQNLRPYWHVFIAYILVWLILFGWVVSIARRLGRIERGLQGSVPPSTR